VTLSKDYLSVKLTKSAKCLVFADVFEPEFVICLNKFAHDFNQTRVVNYMYLGAVFGNPILAAHKVFIITDDDSADAKLANQP